VPRRACSACPVLPGRRGSGARGSTRGAECRGRAGAGKDRGGAGPQPPQRSVWRSLP